MAPDLFSISHLLKTVFSLLAVLSLAALAIVYIIPRLKANKTKVEDLSIGLIEVSRKRLDSENTLILMRDETGQTFLFASGKQGLNLLGRFDQNKRFIAIR